MTACDPIPAADRIIPSALASVGARHHVHARLESLLEQARRHEAALVLATRAGDETVRATAARCLRRTLVRAIRLVHAAQIDDPSAHAIRLSRFTDATQGMSELASRATTNSPTPFRLAHPLWGRGSVRTLVRDGRSHVFCLDASGHDLQEAAICGLHVSHSRFIADLRRTRFTDSLLEASDFTYANLSGTLWQRTRVRNCYFREASFADAAFDDTMFIDCDLRGANFGLDGLELSSTPGAAFIRCDLRDASWCGREFSGFELVDCKILGPAEADARDEDHAGERRSPDGGVHHAQACGVRR